MYRLKIGSPCPKCELAKGLETSSSIDLGLTGWENYDFLHCPVCGAFYAGKNGEFRYMNMQLLRFDE